MEHVDLIQDGITQATQTAETASRPEVVKQNLLHLVGLNIRIPHNVSVGGCHIYKGNLVACSHTRDRFDSHMNAQIPASLHHGCIHLGCSAGLTTVLHAKTHLSLRAELGVGIRRLGLLR